MENRPINRRDLAVALRLAEENVRAAFFESLSPDESIALQEEIGAVREISKEDLQSMRSALLQLMNEMSQSGPLSC